MLSFSLAKAQSDCEGFVTNVQAYTLPAPSDVYFVAFISMPSGWSLHSSTFYLTFADNTTQSYTGGVNGMGNPIINVPVSCSNRVLSVSVTARFVENGGVSISLCADSRSRNFAPFGVCGTSSSSKVSPNPATNILNINLSDNIDTKVKTELVMYNLHGTIVRKQMIQNTRKPQINVSDLKPGRYILKIGNGNSMETQTIIISD